MKRIKSFQCCTCISPAFSNLWSINSLTDRKTCHEKSGGCLLLSIYNNEVNEKIPMYYWNCYDNEKTILYNFIKHPFKEMNYDLNWINSCLFRHQSEVW